MELREKIIDTAVLLLDMLEYYGDEELNDCVVEAIYNNDIMTLYELGDSLERE